MPNVMEDMEKRIRSFSDGPPFAIAYLRYMTVFKDLAPRTAASSFLTVREFCQYIHYRVKFQEKPPGPESHRQSICNMDVSELADVTQQTVMEYLDFLERTVGNRPETIFRKVSVLRRFYQYLIEQQNELGIRLPENPFRDTKIQLLPKAATVMSDYEIHMLLDSIDGTNAVRDKAIILLLLSSGLRMEELANLNEEDLQGSTLAVSGRNKRMIELNGGCVKALNTYIQEYRSPIEDTLKDDALFVSHERHKRLSHSRIQQTIKNRMKAAGLTDRGYTANTLRDTAIQKVLDACESHEVPAAMEYLGFRKTESCKRFAVKNTIAGKMQNLEIPGGLNDE